MTIHSCDSTRAEYKDALFVGVQFILADLTTSQTKLFAGDGAYSQPWSLHRHLRVSRRDLWTASTLLVLPPLLHAFALPNEVLPAFYVSGELFSPSNASGSGPQPSRIIV